MKKFNFRICFSTLFCILVFLILSCNNDEPKISKDNFYYIQYEATLAYGHRTTLHFIDEKNQPITIETGNTGGKFQRIIGPVDKNFVANISSSYNRVGLYIYCSRNNEPFVQKAKGTSSVSYAIDY